LPFLYKKGFKFLVEIGTGDFSIPALAIKASFLRNKIKYIGLDQRENKTLGLENYLKTIGIEYHIYKESFNIKNTFLIKYKCSKGILCFEHSLDDIVIGMLFNDMEFSNTNWDDVLIKCNTISQSYDNYALVHQYCKKLFSMIEKIIVDNKLIIIIHHYLRPFSDDKLFLRNLDNIIITYINDFICKRTSFDLKFQPNFFNEIFWVGGC